MALPVEQFKPSVAWEDRTWLWNERLLRAASRRPLLSLFMVLPFVPLLLAVVMPLVLLSIAVSRLPAPQGPFRVGVHDFEHAGQRIRAWYPCLDGPGGSAAWLPEPRARYAESYLNATGIVGLIASVLSFPLTLVRAPSALRPSAPVLQPQSDAPWPLAVFSHGLLGCVAAYSAVCAEVASHGSIVLAPEHQDGSAAYTTSAEGVDLPFTSRRPKEHEDDKAWRAAQTQVRVDELRTLLDTLRDALADTPVGSLSDEQLGFCRDGSVALLGHSFGGGTVLEAAAAMSGGKFSASGQSCSTLSASGRAQRASAPSPRVSAAVLLDPWLFGCSEVVYTPATFTAADVPTLCVMTQSLMFPQNAQLIQRALHAIADADPTNPVGEGTGEGQPEKRRRVTWVEAAGTRHQEASDFAVIAYPTIRLSAMAGALPPSVSLGRHLAATVGFLALTGAQRLTGSAQQRQARELAMDLVEGHAEGHAEGETPVSVRHRDNSVFDARAFLRHGHA